LQPSPSTLCFFKGGDCSLAIKINYVEADTRRQADVGCRMILEPPLDHIEIDCGVVQSTSTVPRRDQRLLGVRGQREDEKALVCVRECWSEMSMRQFDSKQVVVQPALTANDESMLLSVRQTKISSLDPPLTSVWPAYASEPFSAFSDPPIQLTRSGPCG
jgi:hypothetical protein